MAKPFSDVREGAGTGEAESKTSIPANTRKSVSSVCIHRELSLMGELSSEAGRMAVQFCQLPFLPQ